MKTLCHRDALQNMRRYVTKCNIIKNYTKATVNVINRKTIQTYNFTHLNHMLGLFLARLYIVYGGDY